MGKAAKTVANRTCSALADDRLPDQRGELERNSSGINALLVYYGYPDHYGETPWSCTTMSAPCSTRIHGSHTGLSRASS